MPDRGPVQTHRGPVQVEIRRQQDAKSMRLKPKAHPQTLDLNESLQKSRATNMDSKE